MLIRELIHHRHFCLRQKDNKPMMLFMLIQDNAIAAATVSQDRKELYDIFEREYSPNNYQSEHFINEFSFFLNDNNLLKSRYSNISIELLNRNFTLLPKQYATSNVKEMLALNTGITNPENISLNHIGNEISIAFTIDKDLRNFIERTFNTAHIKHAASATIELFTTLPAFKNEQLFLNIHPHLMELVVKEGKQFKFYNVFKWDVHEDILYFLLFTMEQYSISASSARLTLAANLPAEDRLFSLLKKYIRHVQFHVSKIIDKPLENLPNHYYFNILNDHLCE